MNAEQAVTAAVTAHITSVAAFLICLGLGASVKPLIALALAGAITAIWTGWARSAVEDHRLAQPVITHRQLSYPHDQT